MSQERSPFRIRRIDRPQLSVFSFTLTRPPSEKGRDAPNTEALILVLGQPDGIGVVPERPRGTPADDVVRRLRKELGNGVITALGRGSLGAEMHVRRGPTPRTLVCNSAKRLLVLLDESRRIIFLASPQRAREHELRLGDLCAETKLEPYAWEELRKRGDDLIERETASALAAQRAAVRRALVRLRRRLERRLAKIQADADRASGLSALRRDATALLSNLNRLSADAAELSFTDWETEPPSERTIPIDRRLGPKQQAERLFHQARRLERGATWSARRAMETETLLIEVQGSLVDLDCASDEAAVVAIAARARVLGADSPARHRPGSPDKTRAVAKRLPYREFIGHGNHAILVGRSAADNDALTLRFARPHDLWLHARGVRGSHVVVRLEKRQNCPPEVLIDAATLAAHFSQAYRESIVEITYTPRRYVRKGKGLPAGAVLVDREKVISVHLEADRLRRLLERESR